MSARKFQIYFLLVALFLLLSDNQAHAADSFEVKIVKAPPVVTHKYFDPYNPPDDLPALNPGEKGSTEAKFNLVVNFDVNIIESRKTDDGYVVVISPSQARIKLSLPINIWIPNGAPRKFLRHEKGHRFINETIYEDAHKLVRFHAETMGDSRYKGVGKSYDQALAFAYRLAAEDLNNAYRRYVYDYSMCVGDEYDRLTRHGLNRFPEEFAIQQAFENCAAYRSEFDEVRDYYKRKLGKKAE